LVGGILLHFRGEAQAAPSEFPLKLQYVIFPRSEAKTNSREATMEWTTPQHEEIDLNCEVSAYANAEL